MGAAVRVWAPSLTCRASRLYSHPMLPPLHVPLTLAVVLAVNKCENASKADLQAAEFWSSGLEPFPVSAISGSGEALPLQCCCCCRAACQLVHPKGCSHGARPW